MGTTILLLGEAFFWSPNFIENKNDEKNELSDTTCTLMYVLV